MPNHMLGNSGFISQMDIRIFLRDNDPEKNLLLDDLEFTQEEIQQAVTIAVDEWNDTPPNIDSRRHTELSFPYRWALLQGACANLMTMAATRYRRNQLNYNIPGGAIDDQNKADSYDKAAADFGKLWREWMARKKVELNANLGWCPFLWAYRRRSCLPKQKHNPARWRKRPPARRAGRLLLAR